MSVIELSHQMILKDQVSRLYTLLISVQLQALIQYTQPHLTSEQNRSREHFKLFTKYLFLLEKKKEFPENVL